MKQGPAIDELTDRQRREWEYHRDYALKHSARADEDVARDVILDKSRRWWNAFWSMYDRILAAKISDKRVLVPGCGFGEDAIRLSYLGGRVSAFDLSPEIVEVAAQRAQRLGQHSIDFRSMAIEKMEYPDDFFDLVIFVDILHHVDISATMTEIRRVLKPGGMVVGDELYTHTTLQRVRESRLIAKGLYPLMRYWIYGSETPYITEDEHKIDEHEFGIVRDSLVSCDADYFGVFEGRLFPNRMEWAARIDRSIMRVVGPLAPRLGSRVVFSGEIRKS